MSGEHLSFCARARMVGGSSPRERGAQSPEMFDARVSRIIPA